MVLLPDTAKVVTLVNNNKICRNSIATKLLIGLEFYIKKLNIEKKRAPPPHKSTTRFIS